MKFTSRERLKMLLDTGMVLISSILIFWSLIIAPTIEESSGLDQLTMVLSVAYPVMDLILLFAVVELIFKRILMPGQRSLLLLAGGVLVLIFTDAFLFKQTVEGIYVTGGLIDLGYPIGYVLLGLAGISQAQAVRTGFYRDFEVNIPLGNGQLTSASRSALHPGRRGLCSACLEPMINPLDSPLHRYPGQWQQ